MPPHGKTWTVSEPSVPPKPTHTQVEVSTTKKSKGSGFLKPSQNLHGVSGLSGTPIAYPTSLRNCFHMRCIGTDMLESDEGLDRILSDSPITIHPTRITPNAGFDLSKLTVYAHCQNLIRTEPTRILFVSLPGFGTDKGGRQCCGVLRNLSQLLLTHLEDDDNDIIIDGAAGNPAWFHEGLHGIRGHPRWNEPKPYYWCKSGVMLDDKPFRRKSFVMSTFKLATLDTWKHCFGKSFDSHVTSKSSTVCQSKATH